MYSGERGCIGSVVGDVTDDSWAGYMVWDVRFHDIIDFFWKINSKGGIRVGGMRDGKREVIMKLSALFLYVVWILTSSYSVFLGEQVRETGTKKKKKIRDDPRTRDCFPSPPLVLLVLVYPLFFSFPFFVVKRTRFHLAHKKRMQDERKKKKKRKKVKENE